LLFSLLLVGCLVLSAKGGVRETAVPDPANAQKNSDWNPDDPVRQQAFQLYENHKMSEAAGLLEKVVAQYPRDVRAHEALGVALLSRADTLSDPAQRKADRVHARNELLRARELGDDSDLCKALLAGIPQDGSETTFSERKEVDGAMQRGEAAFANGEWDTAIKEYSRALELDPKLYLAAVDIGDTYFRLKEMDKAGEWFAKAIAIDPNQESAYRYWGDALLSQGKMKEAREKYIQGVVAFPYKGGSGSWGGLHNWLIRNKLKLNDVSIRLPEPPSKNAKGETVITIDPSTLDKKKDDSGAGSAWMAYSMERALWQGEKFAKEYPQEKTYRHTLKEEASALSTVATVYGELQQKKKSATPDPSLLLLSQLKADGLIESYVLLIKPDAEIARDFRAYQAAHRDKLIQLLDKYVVPPAP
jgi:tetratricopeptide (TPR) repeat protein